MSADSNAPERTISGSYEFGPYRLESASRTLFRSGQFVALTPKAAETLLLLVSSGGLVVTKEQLLEQVWPGVVVEEGGIANNVSALRKILKADFGEDGGIATVARRGYRFTVEVRASDGARSVVSPPAAVAGAAPAAAQPIVNEARTRESILVADIDNKTGDAVFDGTIRQALALVLAQSPALDVISDRKVHAALGVMQKAGTPVLDEVALEICQRTNTKAFITGSIFALGEDYVIGLYAKRGDNGDTLVSEQARARGKGDVLRALDQATLSLRGKLGESLASLRKYSSGMMDVASASLDALKAYSVGREIWLSRGEMAAIPHMLRAVELDPQFTSAYSALGLLYVNVGQMAKGSEFMEKAYAMRDRATEVERFRIAAVYHDTVTCDSHQTLDAWRSIRRMNPRDPSAANNAANLLMMIGQFEEAEPELRSALAIEHTGVINTNLTLTLMTLGRLDEAQAMNDHAFASGYNSYFHHSDAYHLAFLRGDEAAMRRHYDAVMGRLGEEDYLLESQANTESFHGRQERARELTRRAAESTVKAGTQEVGATWLAEGALREMQLGNVDVARQLAEEALAMDTGRNATSLAAIVLPLAGDPQRAKALAAGLARDFPQATLIHRYWIPCHEAALAITQGDWRGAVSALEPALPYDFAMPQPFANPLLIAPFMRGLAYRLGERWEEAAAEFGKIASRPNWVRNYVVLPVARRHEAEAREKLRK